MRKYNVPPIPDAVWQKPSYFIAFGFGSGAIPVAPGTFGTLTAIPFYLALSCLSPFAYFLIVLLITLGSMWLCHQISKEINIEDHQGMCLDEIVGFLVTMIGAPSGFAWILLGFIFFRIFDIWKPWPISYVDRNIHGGFGMILDDVVAGFFSLIILKLIFWLNIL